jgi:hypothetical protein
VDMCGRHKWGPYDGAYYIVFMTVGCSVPDLDFVGGGFISPACISTDDLDIPGWWITGLWICSGRHKWGPYDGGVLHCVHDGRLQCPRSCPCRGRIYQPRMYINRRSGHIQDGGFRGCGCVAGAMNGAPTMAKAQGTGDGKKYRAQA